MKEDMEPFYYGCLFSKDFLFYFDQKNRDADFRKKNWDFEHTYNLSLWNKEMEENYKTFLTMDGFKCFPDINVEIPQEKYDGLVKLLQENPKSVTIRVQNDNILEERYKILKEIKDEMHKQLEQGHISKIY
jgi:hypothetical protein